MITRIIVVTAITLFFTPATVLFSQEHPEHPTKGGGEHKKGAAEKHVSTADISAGIKKNMPAHRLNSRVPGPSFPSDANAGRNTKGRITTSKMSNANPMAATTQTSH